MRKRSHRIHYAIILSGIFLLFSFGLFAQQSEGKTDRLFTALIAQRYLPDHLKKLPAAHTFSRNLTASGGLFYECIVYTRSGRALADSGIIIQSIHPNFVTALITAEQADRLSRMKEVDFLEAPGISYLHNDLAVASSGASLLHQGILNGTSYKGKNVIVAIYDSGIDWDHPDFREAADQTKSRILRIWDQTLTPIAGETSPAGFAYGVEYTKAHIENEIDGSPSNFVREADVNGHGTHVAGTAAGNGMGAAGGKYTGLAPEADIVVIKGGNGTFSDAGIIDGLSYLQGLSASLGKPIVVNMSLGGQFGPHDGSRPFETAVNSFSSSAAGRVAVISAGNDNGLNIHNQLTINSSGSGNVQFTVPAVTTGSDLMAYRVYMNDGSNLSATFTAPGGASVTANAGQSVNGLVVGGAFRAYVDNFIDGNNGDRFVEIFIERVTAGSSPAGTWTLTLNNLTINTLTADGWLYYRNAVFSGITLVGGNSSSLVGSPGNASSAITVASYLARLSWPSTAGNFSYNPPSQTDNISPFSSIGPRRDNVQKPEIAAHGQAVISTYSSNTTPAPSGDQMVVAGLYRINQGTSMASPVVAGAVALLLQGNPAATAAQIKTLLTSTANSDALTGAVPNSTWGYGKLDVFKAASTSFSCTPAERKTYQYDNSHTSSTDANLNLGGTNQIAVRFSSDMTGKIGGIFWNPGTLLTDMVVEVRTNSGGIPGTLIATQNVAATSQIAFSWNYVNLSALDIPVSNATDYFVVLYPQTNTSWNMRVDGVAPDGRTFAFSGSWVAQPAFDARIRLVVYNNAQTAGTLANVNSTDTRDINTSKQFINSSCQLINMVTPNGASPVTGSVESRVWIEGAVPTHNGIPFVARHYQITPAVNAASATARITLYFTQSEFDNFNNHPSSTLNLPANSSDAAGKANLRVGKFDGSSSNGSGLPSSYSGAASVIDPVDAAIIWNTTANRWEVSFDVTGFSGFIIQTVTTVVLPITIEYFNGQRNAGGNVLNWKVNCDQNGAVFHVERSLNGTDFSSIATISSSLARCISPFSFTDAAPFTGRNFYRIRITEATGAVKYTGTIMLASGDQLTTSLHPTLLTKGTALMVTYGQSGPGMLLVTDLTGRTILKRELLKGVQSITWPETAPGYYIYRITDLSGRNVLAGKLVAE